MLRQLVRNSARIPLTRAIQSQTRSLHSPFTVLSTESNATAAAAQSSSSARPLVSPSTPQPQTSVEAQSAQAPEKSAFDGAKEFDSQTGSRVYVVSYPDPSLGAPFGVQLGAYPVSEPFAQ